MSCSSLGWDLRWQRAARNTGFQRTKRAFALAKRTIRAQNSEFMKVVYTPAHELHAHSHEFEGGRLIAAKDVPDRVSQVLDAIKVRAIGDIVPPQHFGNVPILRVHTADFVHVLEQAWMAFRWAVKYGFDAREAIPSAWPARGMHPEVLEDIEATLGYYCFDTAHAHRRGHLGGRPRRGRLRPDRRTVGDAGRSCRHRPVPTARPPRRERDPWWVLLPQQRRDRRSMLRRPGQRVAVLDVDFHHGNGTQAILDPSPDVLTVSIHGDPRQFYPHFSGFASEAGNSGRGEGFNLNIALPVGTAWGAYVLALDEALGRIRGFAPDVLVVPLGVDTYIDDPAGGFRLQGADYQRMGNLIGRLKLPTVLTLERGLSPRCGGSRRWRFPDRFRECVRARRGTTGPPRRRPRLPGPPADGVSCRSFLGRST